MKFYNYSKNNHCTCGKLITDRSKQCSICDDLDRKNNQKGTFNGNFKDGRKSAKHFCIEGCGRIISYNNWKTGFQRCRFCANTKRCKILKNTPGYIDGRNFEKYFCIDCKKLDIKTEISYSNWRIGNQKCGSCARIKSWKEEEYRNKTIKAMLSGNLIKPNKPETLLTKLFKELKLHYTFVGDGKIILAGFCPDFINKKEKKIIELYGDYWHNLSDYKKRDKRRLKTYKKLGYKTLIIWEHELKDLNKLIKRLINFNRKEKQNV